MSDTGTLDEARNRKQSLRAEVLAARRALSPAERDLAADRMLRRLLDLPEVRLAHRVAAYVSMGTEPRTDALLAALVEHEAEVLLPVLMADNDLDWATYRGPGDLVAGRLGLQEPSGPRLGPEAVAAVDVVLLPGLAVGPDGHRLGRGGGSYDRALARVHALNGAGRGGSRPTTVLLLHSGEVDRAVPVEAHDLPVDIALTPDGLVRW